VEEAKGAEGGHCPNTKKHSKTFFYLFNYVICINLYFSISFNN
jgi:hypothetical protein